MRDEVAFFQAVRVGLVKLATAKGSGGPALGHAIRQIIANAVVTESVIDVFEAAGLRKPDLSILSGEFLAEVAGMAHKNLAAALLQRLLEDEVRARSKRNVVQGKRFSEMLAQAIARYQSRAMGVVELIDELLEMARAMEGAGRAGDAVTRAARAFVTPEGRPSELALAVEAVVPDRNSFSHGVTASEESLAADEAPLHALWRRITQALAPLAGCELVSRAGVLDLPDAAGVIPYQLRVHQGPSDRFPIVTRPLAAKLEARWCYLLRPGAAALALDPVVACEPDESAGSPTLFLARTLSFEAGARVEAMAVATTTKRKLAVP